MRRGHAERRRPLPVGHGQGAKAAARGERIDGHLGAGHQLLDQRPSRRARPPGPARARRPGRVGLDHREPALPLRRRGLDHGGDRKPEQRLEPGPGWGRRPWRAPARCRRLSVARTAASGVTGCGSPSAAATRRGHGHAAVGPGASSAGCAVARRAPPSRPPRPSSRPARRGRPGRGGGRARPGPRRRPRSGRRAAGPPAGAELRRAGAEYDQRVRRSGAAWSPSRAEVDHQAALSRYQRIVRSRPSVEGRGRPPSEPGRGLLRRADVAVDLARPLGDVPDHVARHAERCRRSARRCRGRRCPRRWRR